MGKRGHLPPPSSGNVKCFVCISSHSKTLSRRIIYALFSRHVVGWIPLGYFLPQTLNLPTPGKNSAGAHALNVATFKYSLYKFRIKNIKKQLFQAMTLNQFLYMPRFPSKFTFNGDYEHVSWVNSYWACQPYVLTATANLFISWYIAPLLGLNS